VIALLAGSALIGLGAITFFSGGAITATLGLVAVVSIAAFGRAELMMALWTLPVGAVLGALVASGMIALYRA